MRALAKLTLCVTALMFALLLSVTQAGLAQVVKNCPSEPASNVPIAVDGLYTGSNCNLYTVGDIDSFVFSGTNGDTYQLAASVNGGSNNICMTVYNGTTQVYSGCTNIVFSVFTVNPILTLTATGTITIDLYEQGPSATQNYAVSVESISPPAPDAAEVPSLGDPITASLPYLTDTNEWTFNVATTGAYEVTATLPSDASQNVCLNIYQPSTSSGWTCTNIVFSVYTATVEYTPSANATDLALIEVSGDDATISSYTFEVSCVVGTCPPLSSGLTLSPSSLTFSDQPIDTTSNPKSVTATNKTSATIDISSIVASPSANFNISSNTCGNSLAAGKKCTVSVTYTATAVGTQTGTLTFSDSGTTQVVTLTGTGEEQATLTPTSYTFPKTKVGDSKTHTFTLKNNLETTLTGISYSISSGSPEFSIGTSTCTTTLDAKKACTIEVTFTPSGEETYNGTLTVHDSANNSPQTSALAGTGD